MKGINAVGQEVSIIRAFREGEIVFTLLQGSEDMQIPFVVFSAEMIVDYVSRCASIPAALAM